MTATITINIRASSIEDGEIFLLDSVLTGLKTRGYTEVSLTCVAVEVPDAPADTPLILLPGFVNFARKLHAAHPDYGFFADINNDFYRNVVLALSGDVAAIQSGDKGTVWVNGDSYILHMLSEVERVMELGVKHKVNSLVMDIHREDLTAYLLEKDLES